MSVCVQGLSGQRLGEFEGKVGRLEDLLLQITQKQLGLFSLAQLQQENNQRLLQQQQQLQPRQAPPQSPQLLPDLPERERRRRQGRSYHPR